MKIGATFSLFRLKVAIDLYDPAGVNNTPTNKVEQKSLGTPTKHRKKEGW